MNRISDHQPPAGLVCIVWSQIGIRYAVRDGDSDKAFGPSAIAVFQDGRWVYADEPRPLQFEPTYWEPWQMPVPASLPTEEEFLVAVFKLFRGRCHPGLVREAYRLIRNDNAWPEGKG